MGSVVLGGIHSCHELARIFIVVLNLVESTGGIPYSTAGLAHVSQKGVPPPLRRSLWIGRYRLWRAAMAVSVLARGARTGRAGPATASRHGGRLWPGQARRLPPRQVPRHPHRQGPCGAHLPRRKAERWRLLPLRRPVRFGRHAPPPVSGGSPTTAAAALSAGETGGQLGRHGKALQEVGGEQGPRRDGRVSTAGRARRRGRHRARRRGRRGTATPKRSQ